MHEAGGGSEPHRPSCSLVAATGRLPGQAHQRIVVYAPQHYGGLPILAFLIARHGSQDIYILCALKDERHLRRIRHRQHIRPEAGCRARLVCDLDGGLDQACPIGVLCENAIRRSDVAVSCGRG